SFFDAPGNVLIDEFGNVEVEQGSVFREELREINLGGGLEYWYDNQFAFRTGYFYEHFSKGDRQFITLGAGLKYSVLAIDMSYLISTRQNNPLANTLRFTLRLEFDELSKSRSEG
ncbi:MAG: PorV/PorQ family protein, partial [Flavobacteriales bacterium]|nr:PorV/PorQ family protein [Flavobacteriales bacterium]